MLRPTLTNKNCTELPNATLADWRTDPASKWAFCRVREIVPTAEIRNDPKTVSQLHKVDSIFDCSALTSLVAESSTNAVVILQENSVLFESYADGMDPDDQHILFSVSKSLLGLVAGCLISDKVLAEEEFITDYMPELIGTAYDGATIRDALDMRVGVYFDEDYAATNGPIIEYRYAANWNPTPEKYQSLSLQSFFKKLKDKDGSHGGKFHYVSPNTDLLAWLFERASGKRYSDLLSEYIWKPLGAERSAYITVDRIGGMRAAGGVCMAPRDLARVGMLMAADGCLAGRQVVPKKWIEDLYQGGDQTAWNSGTFKEFFGNKTMHYRSKWYVCHDNGLLLYGFGIHGQYLFVDPVLKMSIAWLSSEPDPLDQPLTMKILAVVDDIRNSLREL